jgi:hypothetical protein
MSVNAGSVVGLTVLGLAGCFLPDDGGVLEWELEGLSSLGEGYLYEAWIVVDGLPLSAGRFSIDESGLPDLDHVNLTEDEVDDIEAFVVSIEPAVGDDPAPSATKVLAGDVTKDEPDGILTVGHAAAIGTDFHDATGEFILQTPTTASIADDYDQGIWWVEPVSMTASLVLPELPAEGWIFEGWVVDATGTPISTGTFEDESMADADGPGPAAGTDPAPPFPGQDWISPATVIVGFATVISVEPYPDDSPLPFALKPLTDAEIVNVGAEVLQAMDNTSAESNPTGAVSLDD